MDGAGLSTSGGPLQLTASNSDVRAGDNYQNHTKRWSGLVNWWTKLFGNVGPSEVEDNDLLAQEPPEEAIPLPPDRPADAQVANVYDAAVATIAAPADPAHVQRLMGADIDTVREEGSAPVTIAALYVVAGAATVTGMPFFFFFAAAGVAANATRSVVASAAPE